MIYSLGSLCTGMRGLGKMKLKFKCMDGYAEDATGSTG